MLSLTPNQQDYDALFRENPLALEQLKRIITVRQYIELQAEHATCTVDETKKAEKVKK